MRIPITCGSCGRDFSAPDTHIGRKVLCPDCGTGVKVRSREIATPRESGDEAPRSSTRRARGGGPNPKVILGILGVVAVCAAVGFAMKSLPDLSGMSNVVVTSPTVPPASSTGNPGPGSIPATPSVNMDPAKPDVTAKVSERPSEHKPGEVTSTADDDTPRKPRFGQASLGISGTPEGLTRTPNRNVVDQEVDTERGQQLLGSVKSVVLVLEGADKSRGKGAGDLRGVIARRVADRTRSVLEKVGLKVSFGSPAVRATVLKLSIQGKKSPAGTRGTQEVTLTGELVCFDPAADDDEPQFAVVWKQDESVGTIALNAIRSGKIPEKMDRKISDFVNRLRVDWQKAVKAFPPVDAEGESEEEMVAGDQGENLFDSSPEESDEMDAPEMAEDEASDASDDEERETKQASPETDVKSKPDKSRSKSSDAPEKSAGN